MEKKTLGTVKTVVGIIVTWSVGSIVSAVVKNNVDTEDAGKLKRLGFAIGGLALSTYVADKVATHTVKMLDTATDGVNKEKEPEEEKPQEETV